MQFDSSLLLTLLEDFPAGPYFASPDGVIQFWNKKAAQWSGYSGESVAGLRTTVEIFAPIDTAGHAVTPVLDTCTDGKSREMELYLQHKEGHRIPVVLRTVCIRDAQGTVQGVLATFDDRTATVAALDRLERLESEALLCGVTGVANRRHGERALEELLDVQRKRGVGFGVLYVHMDRFKALNDRHGHAVGDVLLRMVANTVRAVLQKNDLVARWTGGEYLVLLDGVDGTALYDRASRVRMLVESTSRKLSQESFAITVSIGATLARTSDTLATLIDRVDRLMLASKTGGRNRVTTDLTPRM